MARTGLGVLVRIVRRPNSVALTFALIDPAVAAVGGLLDVAALGANAEISAYNPSSGYLYTVGGGSGAIVVSDLRDPANAQAVAIATPGEGIETLQSAAVFGNLLAIAVQNTVKTDPGWPHGNNSVGLMP